MNNPLFIDLTSAKAIHGFDLTRGGITSYWAAIIEIDGCAIELRFEEAGSLRNNTEKPGIIISEMTTENEKFYPLNKIFGLDEIIEKIMGISSPLKAKKAMPFFATFRTTGISGKK